MILLFCHQHKMFFRFLNTHRVVYVMYACSVQRNIHIDLKSDATLVTYF
jgi:hypothetical protein